MMDARSQDCLKRLLDVPGPAGIATGLDPEPCRHVHSVNQLDAPAALARATAWLAASGRRLQPSAMFLPLQQSQEHP